MFALMLRRHLPFILSATAATLFIALSAIVALLGPQQRDAQALGDPNAARPAAAAEPGIVGQPPVARPAPLPAAALAAPGGGGEPANLIESRMPDARLHPAAVAAVQCAIGRDIVHDPDLDALAVEVWRAEVQGQTPVIHQLLIDHNLRFAATIPVARDAPPSADPCIFGDLDLRTRATDSWRESSSIGVAAFPEPDGGYPFTTLIVVGR